MTAYPADGDRRGAVLVVALLLLLGLLAVAQGALSLARLELATSSADRRLLQARAAAGVGLHRAFRERASGDADTVPLWARVRGPSGSLPEATYRTWLHRLSRELWLVEAVGRAGDSRGSVRVGGVVWMLDPVARIGSATAALEIGEDAPLRIDGTIDAASATAEAPPLLPGICGPWVAALDSLLPSGRLPPVARVAVGPPATRPTLGRLGAESLLALIPARVSGVGTPSPSESMGRCAVTDPWNWGDPTRPGSACGAWLPTKAADGDLTVSGGVGQGVLVVRDTLTLADSARFYGVVLVGGLLRLEPGSEVRGLARAEGGADVQAGAEIDASTCWAVRALSAASDLVGRPLPQTGPERIGPL